VDGLKSQINERADSCLYNEGQEQEPKGELEKKRNMAKFAGEGGVRLQQSRAMDAAALPFVVHGVV
jgi:hypothetical protein